MDAVDGKTDYKESCGSLRPQVGKTAMFVVNSTTSVPCPCTLPDHTTYIQFNVMDALDHVRQTRGPQRYKMRPPNF